MNDEISADLRAAIAAERHGNGRLTVGEYVELNELEIIKAKKKLGMLNAERVAFLRARLNEFGVHFPVLPPVIIG